MSGRFDGEGNGVRRLIHHALRSLFITFAHRIQIGSIHVDFRDTPTTWGPNYSKSSLPETPKFFQEFSNRLQAGEFENTRAAITDASESKMSVTEQIALQKYADEQATAAQKDRTAAVEAKGFLDALDELEKHPGFSSLFGATLMPTWMPGSAGADAKAILGKVQGKAFLEAIQKMKGMGALSEKEGETATKAYSALTPSMSEAAAKKEIALLKSIMRTGAAKAALMEAAAVDPVDAASGKLQGLLTPR